ncbi:hypothetical protein PG997_003294 [Apiospora hydei]|uniref:Uncharacterized protein n=1 Tax=Apiospora hydei TaxID=1337664 RepID=A0ABR1WYT4_9PEZI
MAEMVAKVAMIRKRRVLARPRLAASESSSQDISGDSVLLLALVRLSILLWRLWSNSMSVCGDQGRTVHDQKGR